MAEPFIAEIRIFPYTFPPEFWAWCNGQTLPISQNAALYAIIGTWYGGDGRVSVGLPYLRKCSPMGEGQGPGLTDRRLGTLTGSQEVTLTSQTMPTHDHTVYASTEKKKTTATPVANQSYASTMFDKSTGSKLGVFAYGNPDQNAEEMATGALASAGNNQPHENRQPFLVMNFCMALEGIFPSRN